MLLVSYKVWPLRTVCNIDVWRRKPAAPREFVTPLKSRVWVCVEGDMRKDPEALVLQEITDWLGIESQSAPAMPSPEIPACKDSPAAGSNLEWLLGRSVRCIQTAECCSFSCSRHSASHFCSPCLSRLSRSPEHRRSGFGSSNRNGQFRRSFSIGFPMSKSSCSSPQGCLTLFSPSQGTRFGS